MWPGAPEGPSTGSTTLSEPTRAQARDLLCEAERAGSAIRAAGPWYVAFVAGLGLVSAGWFASLAWLSDRDDAVAISAGVLAGCVAALRLVLLPRAHATRRLVTGSAHPRHRLDAVVHQPVRFSALSKHAATEEEAGYVAVRKGYVGKWPRTWLRLTDAGREAFEAHLATLRQIAASAGEPPDD